MTTLFRIGTALLLVLVLLEVRETHAAAEKAKEYASYAVDAANAAKSAAEEAKAAADEAETAAQACGPQ